MPITRSSTSGSRLRAAATRIADVALPLVFFAAIATVLALTDWNVPPGTINELEMRPAATMPAWHWTRFDRFFPPFYSFFEDNFGLRIWAIRTRSLLWLWFLRRDPAFDPAFSANVYPGRDNWLFYAGAKVPEDILHADPLSKSALDDWQRGIAERRAWLAARGIRYLFVLAPDKRTIYPERLPAFFAAPRPGLTRRQQLDRRLAGEPAWFDLTPTLDAAKEAGRVYYRWDTHWRNEGAWAAYKATMLRLGLPALPRDLGGTMRPDAHDGDLGRMIGLRMEDEDTMPLAACPKPAPADEAAALAGLEGADPLYAQRPTICPGAPGRVLMFNDSFGSMWEPYLSSQFGFAAYAWTEPTFDRFKKVVEAVRPTVVIEERVERFLILPLR
ncbi:MAG TPA: hypothetical protein VFA03_11705 [Acetobacteraceae bacterium]|nr:hypothetical protein [Acetobacteraceae bacterium]